MQDRRQLDCGDSSLLAANTDCFFRFVKEYFAIPYLSGERRFCDYPDCGLNSCILKNQFDLDFWQEVNIVLSSSENLGVTLLSAVSANFRDGHALHSELDESCFYGLELVGPNDCFDFCHTLLNS
jgi:hypothetical protein